MYRFGKQWKGSERVKLKEFQEKYHIRRIDFNKIKPTENDVEYGSDKLICPYCKAVNEYEGEETEEIIKGTSIQCCDCDKWFYAEGEVTIDTTCTPIENKVLEPWVKRNIEQSYEHMDTCDEKGCEWDSPFGVIEYETYKQYAEPLFKNMEIDKESEE